MDRGKQTNRLCCTGHASKTSTQRNKAKIYTIGPQWFHQEYVPSLIDFGELRVIIITEPSATGIRGRSGRVKYILRTRLDPESELLHALPVQPSDFQVHGTSLDREQLESICLYFYENLRSRPDALDHYESLEVSGRVDVGVIEDQYGEKHFFVNEITRGYGAHLFSHVLLPEPKTEICEACAVAFKEYVTTGMPNVH